MHKHNRNFLIFLALGMQKYYVIKAKQKKNLIKAEDAFQRHRIQRATEDLFKGDGNGNITKSGYKRV